MEELYLQPGADQTDINDDVVHQKMIWKFGLNGGYVYDRYKKARQTLGYAQTYGRVAADYRYVQAFLRTATLITNAGLPVFMYRWDFQNSSVAHHSSDKEALFGRVQPAMRMGHEEACDRISGIIKDAWISFIETGAPSCASLPEWPVCSPESTKRLLVNKACHVETIDLNEFDWDFRLQLICLA